jgi:hypothetical protein
VSTAVHALPSLHAKPSARAGFVHIPVAGSHVPAVWHASVAVHVTGLAPVQTPALHVSTAVHALPSSQVVPSGRAGFEHIPVAGSQTPAS